MREGSNYKVYSLIPRMFFVIIIRDADRLDVGRYEHDVNARLVLQRFRETSVNIRLMSHDEVAWSSHPVNI